MNANELRMGNIVNLLGYQRGHEFVFDGMPHEHTIDWYSFSKLLQYKKGEMGFMNPIPLTEEWLVKFGFDRKENICDEWLMIKKNNESQLVEICENGNVRLWNGKSNWQQVYSSLWCKIKYVNQLQNLYFALTGEELKIKE